jgi:FkbM family methyltransferase
MRTTAVKLGFAAMRARIPPPKLKILARYREQWAVKKLLDRLGITLFLDVGANSGKLAESIRLIGYKGRIVSFEPNPTEYRELAARATGDGGWTAKCCALGDAEGTVALNVTGSNSVFSSILTPKATPPVSSVVSVPARRLVDCNTHL